MRFNLSLFLEKGCHLLTALSGAFQPPAVRIPIAISLGAIGGALSRYYLGLWIAQTLGNSFPYGTFLINITGSFAMGFFVTIILDQVPPIPPEIRLLVAVGFLGSYTTFSSYELEAFTLMRHQHFFSAAMYWVGSPIVGLLSLQLGTMLARLF